VTITTCASGEQGIQVLPPIKQAELNCARGTLFTCLAYDELQK
jgi:hypothetical protein